MTVGNVYEYFSVAFNMVGSVFIAHRNAKGYLIFIVGFLPSAAFSTYYKHWGLLTLNTYFLCINCYGYYKWRSYHGHDDKGIVGTEEKD